MKLDCRMITRRRALHITAAAGGLAAAGVAAGSGLFSKKLPKPQQWHGTALGAEASITLYHEDEYFGARVIHSALAEIERLERIFSLYRKDSHLSRLNREGRLEAPPPELVQLLAEARTYSEITNGAFDVTIQPLWSLYASHFAEQDADPLGPPGEAVRRALDSVDYGAVEINMEKIAFTRHGMAVTLNGIAQGWITDRVAELLREAGLKNVLLNLGEIRGIGSHPDGRPWTAGLRDPFTRNAVNHKVKIDSRALATSAGYGYQFDAAGRHNHLFDPRTGHSDDRYASVSVLAPTATMADALSTGIANMSDDDITMLESRLTDVTAIVTRRDGTDFTWTAPA